jgi:hypothetical protein
MPVIPFASREADPFLEAWQEWKRTATQAEIDAAIADMGRRGERLAIAKAHRAKEAEVIKLRG